MKFKDYRLAAALLVVAILDIGLWLLLTRVFPTALQSVYVEYVGKFSLLLVMVIIVARRTGRISAMRPVSLLAVSVVFLGCSETPPPYHPASFRDDLTQLIQARRYDVAIAYVRSANPERQAEFDQTGYIAVAEDLISLPGVHPAITYDRARDWEMPGTSDVVEDEEWQRAATEFASAYNQKR